MRRILIILAIALLAGCAAHPSFKPEDIRIKGIYIGMKADDVKAKLGDWTTMDGLDDSIFYDNLGVVARLAPDKTVKGVSGPDLEIGSQQYDAKGMDAVGAREELLKALGLDTNGPPAQIPGSRTLQETHTVAGVQVTFRINPENGVPFAALDKAP